MWLIGNHLKPNRILKMVTIHKMSDLTQRLGMSRSLIYLKIKDGSFPTPIKLSHRSIGFLSSDIDLWIEELASNKSRLSDGGEYGQHKQIQKAQ